MYDVRIGRGDDRAGAAAAPRARRAWARASRLPSAAIRRLSASTSIAQAIDLRVSRWTRHRDLPPGRALIASESATQFATPASEGAGKRGVSMAWNQNRRSAKPAAPTP